ncbi:putative 4,5-dihydroxyphthalate dehydrogenase [Pseudobythopirellula maris]|uniref:Putative 4,5-dihydroxyphthalate dehydrogenase n=1 Tax=Pseudobythopirellula maris TaxID=2527991 RepID=A0A5C5ZSJ0_9BACT|nr:Gfo/Idh/MocA family oxidoreductase [Pseudobythopirellula maris]TWT90025.1 putative 4,5-dihydroxyphthalate dehydrogenase [Pseudobythopirellula maris]
MKLRVGLVGLGPSWSARHWPAFRALDGRYEIRAVCDPIAHRAQQVAQELGARPVDGFRALAASDDIDAVMLLSARWFGALPIEAACDAGKAVYCAASIDLAQDEARRLRRRVLDSGVTFMAELPHRLAPATVRLKELIATRLGAPRLVFCNQRHTSTHTATRTIPKRHMIEMVDWCRYVVGREATSVTGLSHQADLPGPAAVSEQQSGSDDYSLMALEFAEGAPGTPRPVAQIACGNYVSQEWPEATAFRRPADMQVVCEHGIAFIDLPSRLVWFDAAGQHTESLEHERPVGEQLLMQFHRSVSSLVLRSSSLEDAYRALTIVLAAERSCREGRRAELTADPPEAAAFVDPQPRSA